MRKLENKVAVVTGGAQGIGKGIVECFAKAGATVIIWDVKYEQAHTVEFTLKAQGLHVEVPKGVDITHMTSVETHAKNIYNTYGRIDILVNNAGIVRDASFLKMTEEQWHEVIQVNLTGVFNSTKAIVPFMVQNNYGKILNISSASGIFGNFGQTNYIAAKAGISGMTKGWGRELGRKGITVNAIAPGPIQTEMLATVPPQVLQQMEQKVAVNRLGTPEDIAQTALFLCSEDADFITGQTLLVDGGYTLG